MNKIEPEEEKLETKEQLIKTVKEWVKIDNEILVLQKELKKRKEEKCKFSKKLIDIMKSNEIDVFDIKDGQIQYTSRKLKKPITKKVLLDTLTNFYDGDFMKANELNSFIMDHREEVIKESISRKITKL
jgi:hypothetical protein